MSLIGQLRDYAACRHCPDGGASSRVGNGPDGLTVTCLRDELQCQQLDVFDPVAYHLSLALLPALARSGRPNQRFVDQLRLALSTHLDERFGALAIAPEGGGLSAWQLQRARELITSDLAHGLSVDRLARECALSRSHFTRAFKRSMGMSPQDWCRRCASRKPRI
ncbi:Bacterial regulatory helix-turn-helix protein, AraC family [compost metagenome]